MDNFRKEFRKHLKIYGIFIRNDLMTQMEYRVNIYFGVFLEILYFSVRLLYALVVYKAGLTIEGLPSDIMYIYIGVFSTLTGIFSFLFLTNLYSIPEHVRSGTLDLFITKPVSLQFWVTFRHVDLGIAIPNVLGGIALIIYGWIKIGIGVSIVKIIGFIGFMAGGLALMYSIMLISEVISFWTVKTDAIRAVTDQVIWMFNVMPMNIFNRWIQWTGVFILPVFVIFNFPHLFILGKLDAFYVIFGIFIPILFLLASRLLWNAALKRYSSANG